MAIDNPLAAGGWIVMGLTGSLIVANALSLQPGPHPAPFFGEPIPVSNGPQSLLVPSALVRDIQEALQIAGYYSGSLDGLSGPMTSDAIRRYQSKNGLNATGKATQALLAQLTLTGSVTGGVPIPRSPGGFGPKNVSLENFPQANPKIRLLQQTLADMGYGPLKVDGVMGSQTSSAIQRFELDRGMPITGEPSDRLIKKLKSVGGL
ncbi:MAG: peptidoglycan-binding domain-containing protein [Stappiaceae bacterium]